MTNPTDLPDHQTNAGSSGLDRRRLFKGAAALAATAVTMKAASAASVTPFGQTGVANHGQPRRCRWGRCPGPAIRMPAWSR